ncbi:MAG: hypothetical protein GY781_00355 [Gammaproteobacteria bacterium]|nr:hypothetical protein [Gammaproteobacteria bacterium]
MAVQPMYKNRWTELIFCAFVVSLISLLINTQNPAGIVIVTSFASTSLALMVAPGAATNSIRAVFLSYSFAMLVSVVFGLIFSLHIDVLISNVIALFFIKFFTMLLATLFLFGTYDAYHPPAIGAMLTYFIDTGFDDLSLLVYVPLAVIFLLATIKCYIYLRHSDEFKWREFGKEFRRYYRKIQQAELDVATKRKVKQIAKELKIGKVNPTVIAKATKLSKEEIADL